MYALALYKRGVSAFFTERYAKVTVRLFFLRPRRRGSDLNKIRFSVVQFRNRRGLLVRRNRLCLKLGQSVRPDIRVSGNQLLGFGAAKKSAERAAQGVGPERPCQR